MTTLAESFLADLDDLSDASDHEQAEAQDNDDADLVRQVPVLYPLCCVMLVC